MFKNWGTWNYIFFILGIVLIGYGIFSAIRKKTGKELLTKYTEESAKKYVFVESILNIITGVSIVFCGLSFDNVILPKWVEYVSWGAVCVCLILDFVLEKKICKPLPKKTKEAK